MDQVQLLTNEERIKLPLVISRRSKARNIIKMSIQNFEKMSSNCIMIQGKPGSGKTTLVEDLLRQMEDQEEVASYRRAPGHITPSSMFHLLKQTAEKKRNSDGDKIASVLILDDVDCLGDEGVLELLKAGFDTKSNLPTNRHVFYRNEEEGREGIKYEGFGIIITNDDFTKKRLTVHQTALLDRIQQFSIDLEPGDMQIYTTHLIEDMLNENAEGYSEEEIKSVVEMFNTTIRRWMKTNAFMKAGVNFSTRLVKKFVDAQRLFGNEWTYYSVPYKQLQAAADIAELAQNEEPATAAVVACGKYQRDASGNFINPRTGKPFCSAYQYNIRKKMGLIAA